VVGAGVAGVKATGAGVDGAGVTMTADGLAGIGVAMRGFGSTGTTVLGISTRAIVLVDFPATGVVVGAGAATCARGGRARTNSK
jgi:hypothetical protein